MTKVTVQHHESKNTTTVVHSVGNWYMDNTSNDMYQLTHLGFRRVDLVATNGETYSNCGGLPVCDEYNLTADEWLEIAGPETSDFVLLRNINIDYEYA